MVAVLMTADQCPPGGTRRTSDDSAFLAFQRTTDGRAPQSPDQSAGLGVVGTRWSTTSRSQAK